VSADVTAALANFRVQAGDDAGEPRCCRYRPAAGARARLQERHERETRPGERMGPMDGRVLVIGMVGTALLLVLVFQLLNQVT